MSKIYPRGKKKNVEITQSFGANFGELEPTFFVFIN